jgi:hypothetical protein
VTQYEQLKRALEQIDLYLEDAARELTGRGACFQGPRQRQILQHIEHIREIIFRAFGP